MKVSRTLLTAGVFALLAMIYVPTPHQGYRLVFSQQDTSIAFFQLLVNVVFAAFLGGILVTIFGRIPKRALYATARCIPIIVIVAVGVGVFVFTEAAANRAQLDEKNGEEVLVLYPTELQWTLTKFRNAATNWRLALRFDEATRVENRIKELQQYSSADFGFVSDRPGRPAPTPVPSQATERDWRSDPVVNLSGLPDQAPAQAPIPRARPVKKSMFDDLIPARTATPGR